jgi:hypothetical protein
MRKTITLALAIGCLSFPAVASAAGGTYSTTFNLNDTSPTFDPGPTYPVVPVTISYAPSGTLTVAEGGSSPLWWPDQGADENGQLAWPNLGLTINGPTGPEGVIDVNDPSAGLSVDGIEGSLSGTTTVSGATQTTTYSSPLIANESWNYNDVQIEDASAFMSGEQFGYDADNGPIVSVPHHGTVTNRAETESSVHFSRPTVSNVAQDTAAYGSLPTVHVTGLPAGVSPQCDKTECAIFGKPQSAGTYTVTITASLNSWTASSSFSWFVTPPHIQVVTDAYGQDGLQYKPKVVGISGDGSWWFGGPTGHKIVPRNLNRIGKLDWTSYGASSARARGVVWGLFGPGSFASDRQFQREGLVAIYEYRPVNGVFTRESVTGNETFKEYVTRNRTKLVHYHFHEVIKPQQSDGRWYP